MLVKRPQMDKRSQTTACALGYLSVTKGYESVSCLCRRRLTDTSTDTRFLVSMSCVIKLEYIFFKKMADIVSNAQDAEENNFVLISFIRQNIMNE